MTDFVVTWVDGNDPEWIREREKYREDATQDACPARYRDWGMLKYWFRAVEKFAPWVHRVHFVTYGHVPEWMDTSCMDLNIAVHGDFIPGKYLPTFNSHTIELNLHRIRGLADQFVYFNDDMFLVSPVTEDYFFKDGMPRDEFILDAVYFAPDSAGAYNGNCLELINKNFSLKKMKKKYGFLQVYYPGYGLENLLRNIFMMRFPWYPGFHYNHLPTSTLKATMEEVWKREYAAMDRTCADRFRSKRNVSPWLFKYWQLASGNFVPRNPGSGKVFHMKGASGAADAADALTSGRYKMICINDTAKTKNFEVQKEAIIQAFEMLLPEKSRFES